jgi:hypothetical protein
VPSEKSQASPQSRRFALRTLRHGLLRAR